MIEIKIKKVNEVGMDAECKMEGDQVLLFRELISINYAVLTSLFPGMSEAFTEIIAETVKKCLLLELKSATSIRMDKKEG